ncbi:reverse transcriptase domain-containing protein [Tanacetum coccineum]
MMASSIDMIEKRWKYFMDDFAVFGDSFSTCLTHLEKMLKRCEDTNLSLNWEKSHFMRLRKLGQSSGKEKTSNFNPIHYASMTLRTSLKLTTLLQKRLLAVVYAFEKFRSYLVMSKSIVYTDHSAIKYLFAKKDAKARSYDLKIRIKTNSRTKKSMKHFLSKPLALLLFKIKVKIGDEEFYPSRNIRRIILWTFSFFDPNVDLIKEVQQGTDNHEKAKKQDKNDKNWIERKDCERQRPNQSSESQFQSKVNRKSTGQSQSMDMSNIARIQSKTDTRTDE